MGTLPHEPRAFFALRAPESLQNRFKHAAVYPRSKFPLDLVLQDLHKRKSIFRPAQFAVRIGKHNDFNLHPAQRPLLHHRLDPPRHLRADGHRRRQHSG